VVLPRFLRRHFSRDIGCILRSESLGVDLLREPHTPLHHAKKPRQISSVAMHGGGHLAVNLQRERGIVVPQSLHNGLGINPIEEHAGCGAALEPM
jgi:hypothetical protein